MLHARVVPILVAFAALAARAQAPLALDEAIRIAERASPQLAAQRAQAAASAALVTPAAQLPDPKVFFGVDNYETRAPRGAADASHGAIAVPPNDLMNMGRVGVMQEYVRQEKRDARAARASADAQREAALIEHQRTELHRDVALAWFERAYAARALAALDALVAEAGLQRATAIAALAAGRATGAEPVAARTLRATLADRRQDLERQQRRATVMLERWLGESAQRPPGEHPDISRLARAVRRLVVDVHEHPQLAWLEHAEAAAEADLKLAAAASKPDWSVELSYGTRGSRYADMVSLMVRMDLPLFTGSRQDPVVDARRRSVERARAETEEAGRRHLAEVRASLVDWEVARERLARHRDELVPLAEERSRNALAAYEGGRGDLATVLEARRGVLEARLAAIATEAELARAWAQLAYLVPEEAAK